MEKKTVYCTKEQLQRLAALSIDSLVGIQFNADESDNTSIYGCFVPIDNPNTLEHFEIDIDGTVRITT